MIPCTTSPARSCTSVGAATAGADADGFLTTLGGEFPDQSLLELAIGYANLRLPNEARAILALRQEIGTGPVGIPTAGRPGGRSGPSRRRPRTGVRIPLPARDPSGAGTGGAEQRRAWLWTWLLGLNLWALDREQEAATKLAALGDEPDFGPLYVARAHLLSKLQGAESEPDLRRAEKLSPDDRTVHIQLIRYLQEAGRWDSALAASNTARQRWPGDFNPELLEARTP